MSKKIIRIATRKFDLKCELCGTKNNVDLICGGPFSQLCKTCEPIVCKVIGKYLDMLGILPFRVVAGTVYQHHFPQKLNTGAP